MLKGSYANVPALLTVHFSGEDALIYPPAVEMGTGLGERSGVVVPSPPGAPCAG